MITITINGFETKEEAIHWLNQYEGGIEQNFDNTVYDEHEGNEWKTFPAKVVMDKFIPEMENFEKDPDKNNFNLELK